MESDRREEGGESEEDLAFLETSSGSDSDVAMLDEEQLARDEWEEDLRGARGFKRAKGKGGSKGRKKKGTRDAEPSEELKTMLGEANSLFASNDLQSAMNVLEEVIRIDPHIFSAWKTLGEVHRELNDDERSLVAWMSAASLRPKDAAHWVLCAKLSAKLNQRDQAILCYKKAILANPKDVDSMYELAMLHKEKNMLNKAINGFIQLNKILPYDPTVVKELARLYSSVSQIQEAVKVYERCLAHHVECDSRNDFSWNELNIMAELYGLMGKYNEAIHTIKRVGRWLLGRADDHRWDSATDDREWDVSMDRRETSDDSKYPSNSYDLPLELRVKLGLYRVELKEFEEGSRHLAFLLTADESCYLDLFFDAAECLRRNERFRDALDFYLRVAPFEQCQTMTLWQGLANCFTAIGDLEQAIECFEAIITADETNIDARMRLAEVYEAVNRPEDALAVVSEGIQLRKNNDLRMNSRRSITMEPDNSALIANRKVRRYVPKKKSATRAEIEEAEKKRDQQTQIRFKKLDMVQAGMEAGVAEQVTEWLDTAGELVDDFRNIKFFFPSDKSAKFRGIIRTAKRRETKKNANDKLSGMASRLADNLLQGDQADIPSAEMHEFRGKSFETWFYVFMQYALCLTLYEEPLDAFDVIEAARGANVFYQRKHLYRATYAFQLACAMHVKNYSKIADATRWYMNTYQFRVDTYRLYTATVPSGPGAVEAFSQTANQKHMLRFIKAIDSRMANEPVPGMASIMAEVDSNSEGIVPTKYSSTLFMIYGQIMNCCKSYVPAMNYFLRAYAIAPNDPLICLHISLMYLYRSMQRQTDNRHIQILQGMTMLYKYAKLRRQLGAAQATEADYNLGRAYHQIGLFHHAVHYYEKALTGSSSSSSSSSQQRMAAYNLVQLFMVAGNSQRAREITTKYLTMTT